MQPKNNAAPAPASLDRAMKRLTQAAQYLDEWHAQLADVEAGRSYVAAGHDALAAIDATVRALQDARAVLVAEIRLDEDEREARVADLLARFRSPTDRILGLAGVIDDAEQATPTDDDEATS